MLASDDRRRSGRSLQRSPAGAPVYSSDEVEIGTVDRVMDNYQERILDGFVIHIPRLGLRFVDAPEVARTAERAVTLTISASEADGLPPPPSGVAAFRPNLRGGRLGRLFGGSKRE